MPIITDVRFAHEDGALADTLAALPELDATVIPEASTDPWRNVNVLRFDDEDLADVEAALEADHTVHAVEPMPKFENDQLLGVEFAEETKLLAPKVTTEDGFVLRARSSGVVTSLRGWQERWLLPDRESLHGIWQYAREGGFEFEVLEFYRQGPTDPEYAGPDAPTDLQREALVAAYEGGYFDEPRGTSLEELADELDISPTAVAGRLKRGMRSLLGMTIVSDRREE